MACGAAARVAALGGPGALRSLGVQQPAAACAPSQLLLLPRFAHAAADGEGGSGSGDEGANEKLNEVGAAQDADTDADADADAGLSYYQRNRSRILARLATKRRDPYAVFKRDRSRRLESALKRPIQLFPLKDVIKTIVRAKPVSWEVYDTLEHSTHMDFMVVVEAYSARHMQSMAMDVAREARRRGVDQAKTNRAAFGVDNDRSEDWAIVNLMDVVCQFFSPQGDKFLQRVRRQWGVCLLGDVPPDPSQLAKYKFRDPCKLGDEIVVYEMQEGDPEYDPEREEAGESGGEDPARPDPFRNWRKQGR